MFQVIKTLSFVRKFKTNIIQQANTNKYKKIKLPNLPNKIIKRKFFDLSYEPPKKPNGDCDCIYCWFAFGGMFLLFLSSNAKKEKTYNS